MTKIGTLTLAMGLLEAAVMYMHCRATGISESQLRSRINKAQREGLIKAVEPLDWPNEQKVDLKRRLGAIRLLDARRNNLVHMAAGIASEDLAPGTPAGSVVNVRTVGLGVIGRDNNSWTIGFVGKRINLDEFDQLTADIHEARLDLVPYMELVDRIEHASHPPEDLYKQLKNAKAGDRL